MDAAAPARDGMAGRATPVSHHDPRNRHGAVTAFPFGFGGEHARASGCPGRDVRGRQKRVVLTPGVLASRLAVMWRPDRARASISRKATGAIVHRSPGRTRHKPSNHCAGKAVCWASPVCRCANSCRHLSHSGPWVPGRHPVFPAPSDIGGDTMSEISGDKRRESAASCLLFKKHAILVEFDQDHKCAGATKRHYLCAILRGKI